MYHSPYFTSLVQPKVIIALYIDNNLKSFYTCRYHSVTRELSQQYVESNVRNVPKGIHSVSVFVLEKTGVPFGTTSVSKVLGVNCKQFFVVKIYKISLTTKVGLYVISESLSMT